MELSDLSLKSPENLIVESFVDIFVCHNGEEEADGDDDDDKYSYSIFPALPILNALSPHLGHYILNATP